MRLDRPGQGRRHPVRRLPPEAARIRLGRSQDPPLRPRRRASHRDARPAPADVVRPAYAEQRMIDAIAAKAPGFKPKVAVILGSGLGTFAEERKALAAIPYAELPGFPQTTVGSHAGKLLL